MTAQAKAPSGENLDSDTVEDQTLAQPAVEAASLIDDLTTAEKLVLDSLQNARTGLTLRQLEARTRRPSEELAEALARLRARGLVVALQTVVPSYAYRYPGIHLYKEE